MILMTLEIIKVKKFSVKNWFWLTKTSAVRWLCEKKKIAAIPNTAFYGADHKRDFENYIRFCFAKSDETIDNFERMMREGFQN